MTDVTMTEVSSSAGRPDMSGSAGLGPALGFFAFLIFGLLYTAYSVYVDVDATGVHVTTMLPYVLLFVALVIALGFEFVNGFHDTANAVATVIYTRALPASLAVIWAGVFNFLGVMASAGAVAFGIISLLPVELILQVGSSAGFAMVFALLVAAIIWNLGTWYLGLPASSSHTLIGSIIGVGVANAMMRGLDGTSGVDWGKAKEIGQALLFSPLIGFAVAAVLLLLVKVLIRNPALYQEPVGNQPPPWWIMLILIGTVPTAYALNRALPDSQITVFEQTSTAAAAVIEKKSWGLSIPGDVPREAVEAYVSHRRITGATYPALAGLVREISRQVTEYGSLAKVPAEQVGNTRNDMYLASEALRFLIKDKANDLTADEVTTLTAYKKSLDAATKFIPLWVKIAVAIALGLGTMVGWKRIVVTVGEKIGKTHMTYAQGASAEIVAAGMIAAADNFGLPVSTTHVLSSGVAGTMAASGSGLQGSTIRNIVMGWVLTLPASIMLSGSLYVLFSSLF